MNGIGKSHAKLIIIGEHAVVYGYPAITIPITSIPVTAKMNSTLKTESTIESRFYSGKISNIPNNLDGIRVLISKLNKKLNINNITFNLQIESDVPIERGLGSSAATSAAIIRCFYQFFKKRLTKSQLIDEINISETVIHGQPSGVDAVSVIASSPIWFEKDKMPASLDMNISGYFVIVDSGIHGRTGETVADVKKLLHDYPKEAEQNLAKLGSLTDLTSTALATNDLDSLGSIFNQAQSALSSLGVSSAQIDNLIDLANKNGSLGTKITGGGRGGCIICITESYKEAKLLSEILENNSAKKTWIQPLNIYN